MSDATGHSSPKSQATSKRAVWARHKERSGTAVLRLMTVISLCFGRRFSRVILYGIAGYFVCFAPAARRASRDYLRRALGREPRISDVFRQVFAFASTIHDRVFLVNNQIDLFDIRVTGEEIVRELLDRGHGAFLMGAHLGSFEVLAAVGRNHTEIRPTMLMYEENARKINAVLAALHPGDKPDMIALGAVDSMLALRERLDAGGIIGILSDRTPGREPTKVLRFLGADAAFPVGPFRLAALMRRPVIFMTGLYRGRNRYDVHFERLADFSAVDAAHRTPCIEAAMIQYTGLIEKHCRAAPYNWFNFFDFWAPPATPPVSGNPNSAVVVSD